MNKDYKTVANEASDEFVEKRSRFIGYVKPVRTEEEAVAFINQSAASTGTQDITFMPILSGREISSATATTASHRERRECLCWTSSSRTKSMTFAL